MTQEEKRKVQRIYCAAHADGQGRIFCADCQNHLSCPMAGGTWSHVDSPGTYCPTYRNRLDPGGARGTEALLRLLYAFI